MGGPGAQTAHKISQSQWGKKRMEKTECSYQTRKKSGKDRILWSWLRENRILFSGRQRLQKKLSRGDQTKEGREKEEKEGRDKEKKKTHRYVGGAQSV